MTESAQRRGGAGAGPADGPALTGRLRRGRPFQDQPTVTGTVTWRPELTGSTNLAAKRRKARSLPPLELEQPQARLYGPRLRPHPLGHHHWAVR